MLKQDLRRPYRGFTLIELMITVVVIGILAAVAFPSYQDHVRRSSLQQAFADMSDQRIQLEQFYQNNLRYGTVGNGCGHDGVQQRVSFAAADDFSYQCALTLDNGVTVSAQTYTITATATTGPAAGHTYTLNSNNVRSTTKFKGANTSSACWLVRGNEC